MPQHRHCLRSRSLGALLAFTGFVGFIGASVLVCGSPLLAREPLVIRVTPAIAQPPAFVTVRTDVEADDDNRSLEVSAEGVDFFTSSRLPLEGSKSTRFNEFHFDNLPAGTYKVTVVLMGSQGARASATKSVVVGIPEDTSGGADTP